MQTLQSCPGRQWQPGAPASCPCARAVQRSAKARSCRRKRTWSGGSQKTVGPRCSPFAEDIGRVFSAPTIAAQRRGPEVTRSAFVMCCHARYKSPFNKLNEFRKGSTRTLRITPQRRPPASRLTSPVRVAPPRSSVSLHQTRSQSPVPIGSQRSAPRPTKHTATATTTARLTKKRLTRGKTRATTC